MVLHRQDPLNSNNSMTYLMCLVHTEQMWMEMPRQDLLNNNNSTTYWCALSIRQQMWMVLPRQDSLNNTNSMTYVLIGLVCTEQMYSKDHRHLSNSTKLLFNRLLRYSWDKQWKISILPFEWFQNYLSWTVQVFNNTHTCTHSHTHRKRTLKKL